MRRLMRFLLYFIIIVGPYLYMYETIQREADYPKAQNGVLNVAHHRGVTTLSGEWEFYPHQLLTPRDFSKGPIAHRQLTVPNKWNEAMNGPHGVATYRLLVHIKEPGLVALRTNRIRFSAKVWIDGTLLHEAGKVTTKRKLFVPKNVPETVVKEVNDRQVEIVIQVANYQYPTGGIVKPILFGPAHDVIERAEWSKMIDVVAFTGYFLFGLYFLGMGFINRRERFFLFFSVFLICAAIMHILEGERILEHALPQMSAMVEIKGTTIISYIAFLFFLWYVYAVYQVTWLARWIKISNGLVIVTIIVTIFYPSEQFAMINMYLVQLDAFLSGLALYAFLTNIRHHKAEATYSMMTVLTLVNLFVMNGVANYFLIDTRLQFVVSLITIILAQSLMLAKRARLSYDQVEQLSEQLIAYDRMKDTFLAKTAHELRTPIHGVMNLTETMRTSNVTNDKLELIHAISRRMSYLINDLLDSEKIRQGTIQLNLRPLAIETLIYSTVEIVKTVWRNKAIEVVYELDEQLGYVQADEYRMTQVLYNLIDNAFKYSDEGTIRLEVRYRPPYLMIAIHDEGIGIDAQTLDHIFSPYTRAIEAERPDRPGLGLGLAITKQIIDLHGGKIYIETAVGQGTSMFFTVPLADEIERYTAQAQTELKMTEVPAPSAVMTSSGLTILVVDDDYANVQVLVQALLPKGHRVHIAYDGQEALRKVASESYDLVILDGMMPNMSGLEVCRVIRQQYRLVELPILMLTALSDTKDVTSSLEAGCNDFLQKPVDLTVFHARVDALLQMRKMMNETVKLELDFMQAQIVPHFLFNALNTILALSYENIDEARELIADFANYLRAKFQFQNAGPVISIYEELAFVDSYLKIEHYRYQERLTVLFTIEDELDCYVPPLALQTLVENAIHHGIRHQESGTVHVRARDCGDQFLIEIEDDGIGMTPERLREVLSLQQTGVGLQNVMRRVMHSLHGTVTIESEEQRGTKVAIAIPKEGKD